MYTYVFAYYLRKNNQSLIFEDNQRDLETATEKLSEYLERDITSENLADIKQKVQDKYRWVWGERQGKGTKSVCDDGLIDWKLSVSVDTAKRGEMSC